MPLTLKPATGSGQMTLISVAGTTTNDTLTLPAKTGNIITSADSGTVTPTMLTQPLTAGTAQASTSGTSIDFTGIPSWVKRVTIIFSGVSTNGSSQWLIQIGDGSVNTSGYVGAGSNMDASGVSITAQTAGFGIRSTSATLSLSGGVILSLVGSNVWVAYGTLVSTAPLSYLTAGNKTLTNALDRVRITTVNGTDAFDAGSINILYE